MIRAMYKDLDKMLQYRKNYYLQNKERILERTRKRAERISQSPELLQKRRERDRIRAKRQREENREAYNENYRLYRASLPMAKRQAKVEYNRAWRSANSDKARQYFRNYYHTTKKFDTEYIAAERERYWARRLKNVFGLSPDQYNLLACTQLNRCKICKQEETQTRKGRTIRLAVDHDHRSGKVRGLLCSRCNLAVGTIQEEVGLLARAISYLTNPVPHEIFWKQTGKLRISKEEYSTLLSVQRNVCVICCNPETRKQGTATKRLSIDHDHATGMVRGLLCCRCNTFISKVNEDTNILAAMISYLQCRPLDDPRWANG